MTRHRLHQRSVSIIVLAASLGLLSSCKTGIEDVHRWANTQQGPRKIVAVMSHDKYPNDLRIEAAMTLVTMKPRSGQRIGLESLLAGLKGLNVERRALVISGMLPRLKEAIVQQLPTGTAPGAPIVDLSFPYKDAAYALLAERDSLVASEAQRRELKAALGSWAATDFARRMDDSSQTYGMGQLLLLLGASGVEKLPALLEPGASKITQLSRYIAELGSAATQLEASARLVAIAKEVDSPQWLTRQAPVLRKRNEASGFKKIEGTRFQSQLTKWQQEEMMRVLASLKKVGKRPIIQYLLALAEDSSRQDSRRAGALAAMEGHVSRTDPKQLERLLALTRGENTPDAVRELSLRRIGELPRKFIIESLYELFSHSNWKVRWLAAELGLKTSEARHLPEFMKQLSAIRDMAITEPLRYGKLIGGLKGSPAPSASIDQFLVASQSVPVRLSAFGYYLEHGNAAQVSRVNAFAKDTTKVPKCPANSEQCEWRCEVVEKGNRVIKQIATVGDFVQHCVIPAMSLKKPLATQQKRAPSTADPAVAKTVK